MEESEEEVGWKIKSRGFGGVAGAPGRWWTDYDTS